MIRGTTANPVGESCSITGKSSLVSAASMSAVVRPVTALLRKPKRPNKWFKLRILTDNSSGALTVIAPPLVILASRLSCCA